LFFVDVSSKKIINKTENAHYNGILSIEFHPLHSFNFATTGMDYSIKFWDYRNLSSPISSIFNNSHWIWDCKFNKKFSTVMINCSSSSIVRGIIFEKDKEIDDFNKNLVTNPEYTNHSTVDYVEFDDSVYSLDWSMNDPWIFAAVSYNSYFYINSIPDDLKYRIMLDN
jgi:WD40 repeat protein